MPRTCTVCTHQARKDIDKALLDGGPYRGVAERFGASASAVYRHRQDHLPKALVKAAEVAGFVVVILEMVVQEVVNRYGREMASAVAHAERFNNFAFEGAEVSLQDRVEGLRSGYDAWVRGRFDELGVSVAALPDIPHQKVINRT